MLLFHGHLLTVCFLLLKAGLWAGNVVERLPSCVSGFDPQKGNKKRTRRKKYEDKGGGRGGTEERELLSRKDGSPSTIPLLDTKWHRTVGD